jgi:hypothetical protein
MNHTTKAVSYKVSRDEKGTTTIEFQFWYQGELLTRREIFSSIPARFNTPTYAVHNRGCWTRNRADAMAP